MLLSLQVQYAPVPVILEVRQEVTGPPFLAVIVGEMVAVGVLVSAHGEEADVIVG